MIRKGIAVRALRDLCTFVGAIALSSYFYNFSFDLRHWLTTLACALACLILWAGFYTFESRRGDVIHLLLTVEPVVSRWLSHFRAKPTESLPAEIDPERELIT